jgi:hypothetical protein
MQIPHPPQNVSNDGREIFDWATNLSKHLDKIYRIKELKTALVKSNSKLCGSCNYWMCSSDCPREILQRNGRYIGPSMNTSGCNKYNEKQYDIDMRIKIQAELAELEKIVDTPKS